MPTPVVKKEETKNKDKDILFRNVNWDAKKEKIFNDFRWRIFHPEDTTTLTSSSQSKKPVTSKSTGIDGDASSGPQTTASNSSLQDSRISSFGDSQLPCVHETCGSTAFEATTSKESGNEDMEEKAEKLVPGNIAIPKIS